MSIFLYTPIDGLDSLHDDLSLLAGRLLLQKIRQATFGKTGEEALRAVAHAYRKFAHEQSRPTLSQSGDRPQPFFFVKRSGRLHIKYCLLNTDRLLLPTDLCS